MTRLLWKEWHERWLWLALWTAAMVITAALGISQSGLGAEPADGFLLPLAFALIAGLGGYGSELKGERATFLYSRNVSWKALLLAKLLPGLATAVIAPALGALAILAFIPPEYHRLLTPGSLAAGAAAMAGLSGAGFLLGLGCSIILPGLAGSMLVMLMGYAAAFFYGYLLYEAIGISSSELSLLPAFLLTLPIAMVIIARFGITLSNGDRLRRFLLVLLGVFLIGMAIDLSPPFRAFAHSQTHDKTYITSSVSPSGRYAIITESTEGKNAAFFVDLRRGKRYPATSAGADTASWLNDNYLCIESRSGQLQGTLKVIRYAEGELRTLTFNGVDIYSTRYLLSPDARRLLLAKWDDLTVCNLETGAQQTLLHIPRKPRTLHRGKTERTTSLADYWWQSKDVIGYLDPFTKKRVLVTVPLSEP